MSAWLSEMLPTIYGTVEVDIIGPGFTADAGDPMGRPYLRLTFGDGLVVCITAHLADMVGGAGRGAIGRHEDLRRVQATERLNRP